MTFKIPTNAKFHDDTPVTAEDVQFTFQFYKDKIKKNNLANIESIEILEPDTLKLTFSTPSAYSFLNDLNTMTTYVVPKHVWENIENPQEYEGDDSRIGCGPFKFVSYDAAAQTSYYEAVEDYFGGEVSIKKVSLHSYATHEALAMALINGEVDSGQLPRRVQPPWSSPASPMQFLLKTLDDYMHSLTKQMLCWPTLFYSA